MSFYAFKLTQLRVNRPRGRIPDNDLVTFSVFVNQRERGGGGGLFPDLAIGSVIPARAIAATTRRGAMTADWIVGPFELAPGDIVNVIYSGMNISDSQLDLSKQTQIEVKILDTILTGAVGAIGGVASAVIGAALGFLSDPVGTILGIHPQGPCNGLVFSDSLIFSGAEVTGFSYGPPQFASDLDTLPGADEASFTKSYTDEATHDTTACGDVALTDVTVSVLRVPRVSVKSQDDRFFGKNLTHGLRQFAPAGSSTIDLKKLLLVTS